VRTRTADPAALLGLVAASVALSRAHHFLGPFLCLADAAVALVLSRAALIRGSK